MASHENLDEYRAEAPRAPEPSRALQKARAAQDAYRVERGQVERRGMTRGLLLLALIVLLLSFGRAGLERVFVHGWWRHW